MFWYWTGSMPLAWTKTIQCTDVCIHAWQSLCELTHRPHFVTESIKKVLGLLVPILLQRLTYNSGHDNIQHCVPRCLEYWCIFPCPAVERPRHIPRPHWCTCTNTLVMIFPHRKDPGINVKKMSISHQYWSKGSHYLGCKRGINCHIYAWNFAKTVGVH